MKKLVLLLTALLVLSTLVSSPVLAARPSLGYRIHSMFGILCRSFFLFRGVAIVPEEIPPMNNGGSAGGMVGGDADDYGNGRWGTFDETKPISNLLGGCPSGSEAHGPEAVKSVE
ncbi:MAG: hypothetical protein WC674_01035 [Candidatus Krumholzibacteriia bacterium]